MSSCSKHEISELKRGVLSVVHSKIGEGVASSSTLDPRIPPPNIFLSIPIVETFVPRAPLPPSGSTTPLHHATRVKLSRAVVRIKLGRSLFDHQNIPIIQRDN
ncbi:hypothetical protein VDGE_30009 [Verticillium dahliae]|uniref:Uncharacterized protein n=1 Tax=Verticillium dahliae TaxID=27337 RepID=A0A444S2I1_VERDA|nr:hypothetical protein VDGE_30009 [Verticillium dahliae]